MCYEAVKVPGDAMPNGTFSCGHCEDFRFGMQGDTTLQFKNKGGIVADIAGEEFFLVIWGEKQSSQTSSDGRSHLPHSQHLLYCPEVPQADQNIVFVWCECVECVFACK